MVYVVVLKATPNTKYSKASRGPTALKVVQFTTVKASKECIKREDKGNILVRLNPGERVVALGEYGLTVLKGKVTILGATLSNTDHTTHNIFALSSHSLPVIRYLDSSTDEVIIRLSQLSTRMRDLKKLSPHFARLWNESATPLAGEEERKERSSFQILFTSVDGPKKIPLQHVYSAPEWNEAFANVANGKWNNGKTSTIMVCGPKSSGKSTFTKLLINRLLTDINAPKAKQAAVGKKKKPVGVMLLDIDPGQPEYSPPGQLSLVHVTTPNFGPSYAHPSPESGGCTINWSHSVCAISPSQDPDHYMACVLDLLNHYKTHVSANAGCPLIINTPGWVLGTGLELLVEFIKKSRPSALVYMSTEGPSDVVKALKHEAGKTPFITLPSQISEFTTRTAAQLRIMQTMSYFHLLDKPEGQQLWSGTPMTSIPPWVVKYTGKNKGIAGIMSIGEQPDPSMLIEALNGALVAVVVIDDSFEESYTKTFTDFGQKAPPVTLTTKDGIPYFNADYAAYPDPKKSRCLGLAVIRGVDTHSKILHLLTPISPNVLKALNHYNKKIALVSGKLETPGWAYTEELHKRAAMTHTAHQKQLRALGQSDMHSSSESDEEDEVVEGWEDAPWIEKVEGHAGRGVGARVWKVRRNLEMNQ